MKHQGQSWIWSPAHHSVTKTHTHIESNQLVSGLWTGGGSRSMWREPPHRKAPPIISAPHLLLIFSRNLLTEASLTWGRGSII